MYTKHESQPIGRIGRHFVRNRTVDGMAICGLADYVVQGRFIGYGEQYSLEDILEDMQRLGFVGAELGGEYLRQPLASGWSQSHVAESDLGDGELQQFRHVRFLKGVGVPVVVKERRCSWGSEW